MSIFYKINRSNTPVGIQPCVCQWCHAGDNWASTDPVLVIGINKSKMYETGMIWSNCLNIALNAFLSVVWNHWHGSSSITERMGNREMTRFVVYTVRCRYNAVIFLKNINKRHPIARPLGRGMGCLLWIQDLIDILPQFLQLLIQYLTTLHRVITALYCIVVRSTNHLTKHQ